VIGIQLDLGPFLQNQIQTRGVRHHAQRDKALVGFPVGILTQLQAGTGCEIDEAQVLCAGKVRSLGAKGKTQRPVPLQIGRFKAAADRTATSWLNDVYGVPTSHAPVDRFNSAKQLRVLKSDAC